MNVAFIHNYYQQPGGEDLAFANERDLLRQAGHTVVPFTIHNDQVKQMSGPAVAARTVWNQKTYREIRNLVRDHQIDVCHFHNTFPLISPAGYYAARRAGACVVQTIHNYRLLCPAATLYRDGKTCEECVHAIAPWRAVVHRCYRLSAAASAATASMLTVHRWMGTWRNAVDRYIALTEFSRAKLIEGGLPAERIAIKKNFLQQDPGEGAGDGNYALFIGRLTSEKGLATLLKAWQELGARLPLKIIGDGPVRNEVEKAAATLPGVEYLGRVGDDQLDRKLGRASFLVFPSEWYEGLPRTIIESFAKGTPVLGSDIGSVSDLIEDGKTGLRFRAGDAADLGRKAAWMIDHPSEARQMRRGSRQQYLREYTPDSNYAVLMRIYSDAIHQRRRAHGALLAEVHPDAR